NMSGDPEQEYFADGITEDIITDVSKISGLFVIARNSSFTFKKQNVDIKEVGRKLGVRHADESMDPCAGTGPLRARTLRRSRGVLPAPADPLPGSDVTRAYLASLYGHTGRHDEARRIWRELMDLHPEYTVEQTLRVLPYKDPAPLERFLLGLRKAG